MVTDLVAAAIQMTSSDDVTDNLKQAERSLQEASRQGANLMCLPECFAMMPSQHRQRLASAEVLGKGPIQAQLSVWARQFNCWIVGGTISIQSPEPERPYAGCLVYNPEGECVLTYQKLHLFDANLDAGKSRFQESRYISAGNNWPIAATPWGALGVNICYDLRFPELSRLMSAEIANQALNILVVPSAFAETTGRAHWEVLLRARAIENQCYVIAPAQCGEHYTGRSSYGYTMIIDPWGEILACAEKTPSIQYASLSLTRINDVRGILPVLKHRRLNLQSANLRE